MIKKIVFNKLIYILLISIICISIPNKVQADETSSFFSDIMDGAKDFAKGTQAGTNVSGDGIKDMFGDIFGVFITAGVIVAFIITAILGIKFLLASPEGKAEIKETMTPYAIGCIVTFGAYAIWKIAIAIFSPLG